MVLTKILLKIVLQSNKVINFSVKTSKFVACKRNIVNPAE